MRAVQEKEPKCTIGFPTLNHPTFLQNILHILHTYFQSYTINNLLSILTNNIRPCPQTSPNMRPYKPGLARPTLNPKHRATHPIKKNPQAASPVNAHLLFHAPAMMRFLQLALWHHPVAAGPDGGGEHPGSRSRSTGGYTALLSRRGWKFAGIYGALAREPPLLIP